jgi:hypothetical protein
MSKSRKNVVAVETTLSKKIIKRRMQEKKPLPRR